MFRQPKRRDMSLEMSGNAQKQMNAKIDLRGGGIGSEYDLMRQDLHFPSSPPKPDGGAVAGCNFSRKLVDFLTRSFTIEGDLVLDPFAGTATAMEVAATLGRNGIGFEISREQCELLGSNFVDEVVEQTEPDLPEGWLQIFGAWKSVFEQSHPSVFGSVEKVEEIGEEAKDAA
jgi:hypothetical protein